MWKKETKYCHIFQLRWNSMFNNLIPSLLGANLVFNQYAPIWCFLLVFYFVPNSIFRGFLFNTLAKFWAHWKALSTNFSILRGFLYFNSLISGNIVTFFILYQCSVMEWYTIPEPTEYRCFPRYTVWLSNCHTRLPNWNQTFVSAEYIFLLKSLFGFLKS